MSQTMDCGESQDNQKSVNTKIPTMPSLNNLPIKGARVVKALSENKIKRLNILTFINDKKDILFTKKAFKFEKERIWRQIFKKMLEFGMVSSEKDWRYVRDVSFSNWRKRAQKRLKHLAASGHRLNMDECEFLIYDILGQTPDKVARQSDTSTFNENVPTNGVDDEESDEYMIDSDEDEDDVMFDEMLYIPKIVFNDNVPNCNNEKEFEKQASPNQTPSINCSSKQINETKMIKSENNGYQQRYMVKNCHANTKPNQVNDQTANRHNSKMQTVNSNEENLKLNTNTRLIDLEIENKILKNRYMKLKIFELEQTLGLDHCKEVKELMDYKFAQMQCHNNNSRSNKTFK